MSEDILTDFVEGELIYRWQRTSFSVWKVDRVSPKTLWIKPADDKSNNYYTYHPYRLLKKRVNDPRGEWWGAEWATNLQLLLAQIDKDLEREVKSYSKFNKEYKNARAVLTDALT